MTPEIMKEAAIMLAKHGKDDAIDRAIAYANEIHAEIEALKYYDADVISAKEERRNFWFAVASWIKERV